MKRPLFHVFSGAVLALGISLAVPVWAQETIAYPDDFPPLTLYHLHGNPNALAPPGSTFGRSNSLSGNSVTLNSGTVSRVFGAITSHSNDSETVTDNRVFINGGTVNRDAYGGYSATAASGNSLTVSNGTMSGAVGGRAGTMATGNSVTVSNGTITWRIVGGYAHTSFLRGTTTTAADNSVTISGGRMEYAIFGGLAENFTEDAPATVARNNTVTVRGTPLFGERSALFGGCALCALNVALPNEWTEYTCASRKTSSAQCVDNGGVSTGNTLNFHSTNLTVAELDHFQKLNFFLPATLRAGGTALTVTGEAVIIDSTVNVYLDGAGPSLQAGDRFTLINAETLTGDFQPTSGMVGDHAYTVLKEGNNLVLVIGPAPTRDYTGQWIKADEDAWGLTVLQNFPGQPRYIFVPWYTYDSSGNAAWYLFQGDNWAENDTITANVYRYTGPAWGTHDNYDSGVADGKVVGTATLTFTSATTATFQYNVEGAERAINLDRLDGAPGTDGLGWRTSQYSGQWVKADEDAWGLTVLGGFPSNPSYLFVPWYTYDKDGNAAWYIFQGEGKGITELSADVYRYTGSPWGTMPYDNSAIVKTKVGTAKLTFSSPWYSSTTTARFEYDIEGSSRTIELVKLE